MSRLSDRAFQIIKNEIDRRYTDSSEDQIERAILIARLQTLRSRDGKPMDRVQIWEELSDIMPNFDQNILIEAAHIDADSPLMGASIGVGAVAMLVSTAMGIDTLVSNPTAPVAQLLSLKPENGQNRRATPVRQNTAQNDLQNAPSVDSDLRARLTVAATSSATTPEKTPASSTEATVGTQNKNAFEQAQKLGWQAALKSQNPPHSAQRWGETAALWQQALVQLEAVSSQDPDYAAAQIKKTLYQQNLQQVKAHQEVAQLAEQPNTPVASSVQAQAPRFSGQPSRPAAQPAVQNEDSLKLAKRYGWQAAVASQNAPHPPEKWADISRLWQTALINLDGIQPDHPSYGEAQDVKARYQQNLAEIRQRYQMEQTATQRLQSLQATITEIGNNVAPSATKSRQLEAIIVRLKTIPAGTQAHSQAQQLIVEINRQLKAIATSPSTKIILSANE
ncbi:MAG: hypothetical protein WBD47_02635 [Phormidesmis sp.]